MVYTARWMDTHRPVMKKRGIKTSRNIEDVSDDILAEQLTFLKDKMSGFDPKDFLADLTG